MTTHAARARRRLRSPSSFTRPPSSRPRPGLQARRRYAFDNSLSRGPTALIGWLALLSMVVVVTGAAIIVLLGVTPTDGGELSAAEAA